MRVLDVGIVLAVAGAFACSADGRHESTSSEPSRESVVRSVSLRTAGAISDAFRPIGRSAFLHGVCNPEMWANLGITFDAEGWERITIAFKTEDPIQPGQTGEIELDWMSLDFLDGDYESHDFKAEGGGGRLELTVHDVTPGVERLSGTMRATEMKGSDAAKGQTLDIEVEFDLDFSCKPKGS